MDSRQIEEAVTKAVTAIFESQRPVEATLHAKHHAWIDRQIARDDERIALYKELRKQAATFLMVGLIGAIATRLWTGHWPIQ